MARAGGGPVVHVEGLREFQRGLRDMDRDLAREFRDALADVGRKSAEEGRYRAQGGTRQQAAAAYNIENRATMKAATISIGNGNNLPFAVGAFFGAKAWPQFPTWVGNSWEVGVAGQGPYHVNAAIADNVDQIEDDLGDLVEQVAVRSRAFPDHSA